MRTPYATASRALIVAAALASFALPSGAASQAQISLPNVPGQISLGSGVQSLNLDAQPYESAGGVTFVGKAQADDGTGTVRVYSEIDSRGVSGIPDLMTGLTLGQTQSQATLIGTPGSEASCPPHTASTRATLHTACLTVVGSASARAG